MAVPGFLRPVVVVLAVVLVRRRVQVDAPPPEVVEGRRIRRSAGPVPAIVAPGILRSASEAGPTPLDP